MKGFEEHHSWSQLIRFLLKNNKPEKKILHSCCYWISLDLLFYFEVKTDIFISVFAVLNPHCLNSP